MISIVFFGTDEFAASILQSLLKAPVRVLAVVTKPDRAKKRNKKLLPPPVKEFLLEEKVDLPLYQPEKASTAEFAETLRGYKPDLFVVVSYGEIISDELLQIPKMMPVNIHPSALPKYRGASPLRSALLNGDGEIGIAVIEMVKAMDAGDVVKYTTLQILPEENHSSLEKRVFEESAKLLLNLIRDFETGKVVKEPQVGDPTFTKKFLKKDLEINWQEDVHVIFNKIRAFGTSPGAFCLLSGEGDSKTLKITKASIVSDQSHRNVGTLCFSKEEGWKIACKGGVLEILELQMQNKRLMSCKDFINGARGMPPAVSFA